MTTNFNLESLIVPLQDDAVSTVSSSFIKMVKEREEYVLYSLHLQPMYFSITYKGCNGSEQFLFSGNLDKDTPYRFIPQQDGEYIIGYTTADDVERTHIFTHYPYLLSSIIKEIEKVLSDCDCKDKTKGGDCDDASSCEEYISLTGELLLLFGLSRNLTACNGRYDVMFEALYNALSFYKCSLYADFCEKQVSVKLKDDYEYSDVLFKKIIAIIYLLLYFYEREISNQEREYLDYIDEKFNFKVIKNYILKAGVEILEIEHIFMSAYYKGCSEEGTCTFGCLVYDELQFDKQYNFEVNEVVNGIYDTLSLRNSCPQNELFVNNLLYKDDDLSVLARSAGNQNPTTVLPGEEALINVIIRGTKPRYSVINVPYVIDGVTIGKYKIIFSEVVVDINTPPVITSIVKILNNREVYNFTVSDFENHFVDEDNDILDKIVLIGDTSSFKLATAPYVSGTIITRDNINKLTFTAKDTDSEQQLVLNWKAYDSRGAESN